MFGSGSPAPNTEVEADSSRTYYYDQSIAGADIYTDTVLANTPAGYEFAGWYENPDGIRMDTYCWALMTLRQKAIMLRPIRQTA